MKESNIPDNTRIWAELWMDEESHDINFKFHTNMNFTWSRETMKRFRNLIQTRLDNAKLCPFHEEEK